jgi:cyclic-di-GMP-binding protein
MPSFDIASKVDLQTLDNAINVVSKEVKNRFDFKGSHVVIELNKKDFKLSLEADSEMKLDQIKDVLISKSLKQDDAKKIVKLIKDSGLKVQAAIMDDIIRVTGKKIDDLQEVIQASKEWNVGLALQFVNMK